MGRVSGTILTLHIPVGVKQAAGLSDSDVNTFSIDDGSISVTKDGYLLTSISGDYSVSNTGSEYIIQINMN